MSRALEVCATMIAVALPSMLTAQSRSPDPAGTFIIAGTVRDAGGLPLYGAELRAAGAYASSDTAGAFTLRGLPFDTVTIRARRIGYNAAQLLLVRPESGQRIDLVITLTANAVALGTIVVEGKALDTKLWAAGFYQRRKLGRGRFISPDLWSHFGGAGIGSLLRETPQVIVERQNNQEFAYSRSGQHLCRMNVFIDGAYAAWASPGSSSDRLSPDPGQALDQLLPRTEIRAIEIYGNPSSVPIQFLRAVQPVKGSAELTRMSSRGLGVQSMSATRPPVDPGKVDCGAIVIWTDGYAPRQQ